MVRGTARRPPRGRAARRDLVPHVLPVLRGPGPVPHKDTFHTQRLLNSRACDPDLGRYPKGPQNRCALTTGDGSGFLSTSFSDMSAVYWARTIVLHDPRRARGSTRSTRVRGVVSSPGRALQSHRGGVSGSGRAKRRFWIERAGAAAHRSTVAMTRAAYRGTTGGGLRDSPRGRLARWPAPG